MATNPLALREGNPMGMVATVTLALEVIVLGLAVPVMIMVSDVSPLAAGLAGGGAAVLCLVAALAMRTPRIGYPLGWLTQVVALGLGFLTYGMFIMGAVFLMLWVTCIVLGHRIPDRGQNAA